MHSDGLKTIKLDTQNTTLLLSVNKDNTLGIRYYGKKLENMNFDGLFSAPSEPYYQNLGISSFGEYDFRESSILAEYENGSFVTRLRYCGHTLTDKPDISPLTSAFCADETLQVYLEDEISGLTVIQYYSAFKKCDVITSFCVIKNGSKSPCYLRKAMSIQLDLTGDEFEVTTFNGAWGRERYLSRRKLGCGIFRNESKCGASSAMSNPLMYIHELRGARRYFAINLVYSGNHLEEVEVSSFNNTRILAGINDFMFRKKLSGDEIFKTPEAVLCVADSESELETRLHAFIREHIVRGMWAKKERPIVFNNWEATYFDSSEEKILRLADGAVKVGAELFVMDDGWFGTRQDEYSSMGDWFPNYNKFKGGLKGLSEKLRTKGLKFGFWVEPEMISENSELYRTHPEFAMRFSDREPRIQRGEMMLDLTNPAVRIYLVDAISRAIEECQAEYIKWDFNRLMTDVFTTYGEMGAYFHEYILGLYEVIGKLTEQFPEVLFESCASGGARMDLGLLCFMPQVWTSDNTDARDRIAIQEGTLFGYPQSVMSAHVSISPNHQTGNSTSLENRFNVASCGLLGFEIDFTKCTDADMETMRIQTEFYKEHRRLLQFGKYQKVESGFDSRRAVWMVLGKDEAIAVVVSLKNKICCQCEPFLLGGLEGRAMYEVKMRQQSNVANMPSFQATGSFLCQAGLSLGNLFDEESDRTENSNSIASRMFYLRKIKEPR